MTPLDQDIDGRSGWIRGADPAAGSALGSALGSARVGSPKQLQNRLVPGVVPVPKPVDYTSFFSHRPNLSFPARRNAFWFPRRDTSCPDKNKPPSFRKGGGRFRKGRGSRRKDQTWRRWPGGPECTCRNRPSWRNALPVPQRNAQVGPHSALKWTLRSSTRPSPPPACDPRFVKPGFAPVCNRQVRN